MKKVLSCLFVISLLLLCLSGCEKAASPSSEPQTPPDSAAKEEEEEVYQPEVSAEEVAYHIIDAFIDGDLAAMAAYLSDQSEIPLAQLRAYLHTDEAFYAACLTAFSRTQYTILSTSANERDAKVKVQLTAPDLGALLEQPFRMAKQQAETHPGPRCAERLAEQFDDELIEQISAEDVSTLKSTFTITFVNEDGRWRALADEALYNALTGNLYAQFRRCEDQ